MPMNQLNHTARGRTWEYALAQELAAALSLDPGIQKRLQASDQHTAYQSLSADAQESLKEAAQAAVSFLLQNDPELAQTQQISFQSGPSRNAGDVRDILVQTSQGAIGLAAKRHPALKHPRLSGKRDFGSKWYGVPWSQQYQDCVKDVFAELYRRRQEQWEPDDPFKHQASQVVLEAFKEEIESQARAREMMRYLLGEHDFYRIVNYKGNVTVESFNMNASLGWGKRLELPSRIIAVDVETAANATVTITLDKGWALSFRLHTALGKVEASLKFDVQLRGAPPSLSQHQIPLG